MDENTKKQADAIRSSWTRWLANADDAAVLRFHERVVDLLESERNPIYDRPPRHKPAYYSIVNHWLVARGFEPEPDQNIDEMDLPDDIRNVAERAEKITAA